MCISCRTAWLLALTSCVLCPSFVQADGGTLRLLERAGDYQIAVFTSPVPLRAGPVDVSVLVQDGTAGEPVSEARVTVCITPAGPSDVTARYPATAEMATNKLLRAAHVEFPAPGRYEVAIHIDGPRGPASVHFELEVAESLPRWRELWPWFGWPALAVLLFCIHQALVHRRTRGSTFRTSKA